MMKKLFIFCSLTVMSICVYAQNKLVHKDTTGEMHGALSVNVQDSSGHSKSSTYEIGVKSKNKKAYLGINPSFGFGWNRFADNGNIGVSKQNADLTLDKGPEFIFNIISAYVDLARHHRLRLSTNFGLDYNTYHFERDITLQKGQDELTILPEGDTKFSKNLLRSTYLTMPLLLTLRPVKDSKFEIAAGVEGGLLLGAKTKQISDDAGKVKTHGTFNLNPVRYGLFFGMGYEGFGLYAKYYLSDVFANGQGPKDFRTVAIGISLGLF